jgi:hypothetical protein
MGLTDVLTSCKAICAGVPGIASAYDHTDMPASLNTSDIPAALCLPNAGDLETSGAHAGASAHRVRIVVVGLPGGRGTVAQRMSQLVPLVKSVRDAFAASLGLGVASVEHSQLTKYEFIAFTIGANDHAAVEFTLAVYERDAITVAK